MKYRRNSDADLRARERAFQESQTLEALELYNVARVRAGLPLWQAESLENLERYNTIRVTAGLASLAPIQLEFGYPPGLPDALEIGDQLYTSTPAAWGARGNLENKGVSLLWDRQSVSSRNGQVNQMLIDVLNGNPTGTGAINSAIKEASRLLRRGVISSDEAKEVILYDGNLARIVANTNASYGHLYIVGFLKVAGMGLESVPVAVCGQCKEEPDPGEKLEECNYCHKEICERCGNRCPDCKEFICEEHEPTMCKFCKEVICRSEKCNSRGGLRGKGQGASFGSKECPKCGELYCKACRSEIASCPCSDDWCNECDEEQTECGECGEIRCSCTPCPCDQEEDEEEETANRANPYHRSVKNFDTFSDAKARFGDYGPGLYFSDEDSDAIRHYGSNLYQVTLDLKSPLNVEEDNPVVVKKLERLLRLEEAILSDEPTPPLIQLMGMAQSMYHNAEDPGYSPARVIKVLKSLGYDGIIVPSKGFSVVFDPSQVTVISKTRSNPDDLELGGWAVVHDSGDLIADGFHSQGEAQEWLQQTIIEGLLDDAPESYHVTLVED